MFLFIIFVLSFAAQNSEELSFVKGERLEILDRPPADPDWYRARNGLGSIGLIPKNYVQVFKRIFDAKIISHERRIRR